MVCHAYGKRYAIAGGSGGIDDASYVVPDKPNRLLKLILTWSPSSVTLSTLTFNGASFTVVPSTTATNANGTTIKGAIYTILAPAVGTGHFILASSGGVELHAELFVLYNVDQSTPTANGANGSGNSNTPSLAVSGADEQYGQIYSVLGFLTPAAVIPNDGFLGGPDAFIQSQLSSANGGNLCACYGAGYNGSSRNVSWTLDGSAHQYVMSACVVNGTTDNTEVCHLTFENISTLLDAEDAGTFNYDVQANSTQAPTTSWAHTGSQSIRFTRTDFLTSDCAREWWNFDRMYISFWIYIVTRPSSRFNIGWISTYSDNGDVMIDMDSAGRLIAKINYADQGTSSNVVPLNTPTKISAFCFANGASGTQEIKLNDTQEIMTYHINVAQTNVNCLDIGLGDNAENVGEIYVDDYRADYAQYPLEPSTAGSRILRQLAIRPGRFKPGNAR